MEGKHISKMDWKDRKLIKVENIRGGVYPTMKGTMPDFPEDSKCPYSERCGNYGGGNNSICNTWAGSQCSNMQQYWAASHQKKQVTVKKTPAVKQITIPEARARRIAQDHLNISSDIVKKYTLSELQEVFKQLNYNVIIEEVKEK